MLLGTILCKFGQICATGNAFVRPMPLRKMHIVLGSRSERGGARRAPTKRVYWINHEKTHHIQSSFWFSRPRSPGLIFCMCSLRSFLWWGSECKDPYASSRGPDWRHSRGWSCHGELPNPKTKELLTLSWKCKNAMVYIRPGHTDLGKNY